MMIATEYLAREVYTKRACKTLGIPRASYYYYRKNIDSRVPAAGQQGRGGRGKCVTPMPPLALSPWEEQQVLDTLHTERFCDKGL